MSRSVPFSTTAGVGAVLSPVTLKCPLWFRRVDSSPKHHLRMVFAQTACGIGIGAALFWLNHRVIGGIAMTLGIGLGSATAISNRFRLLLARLMAWLVRGVGTVLAWSILAPIFVIGFGIAGALRRLCGADELHMRRSHVATFWIEADRPQRRNRYIASMFASEARTLNAHVWLRSAAWMAVLLGLTELGLRLYGFGRPVLYIQDRKVGYYPAPHQRVTRYGGEISTNNFGMRAPDIMAEKPAGTFRILILGDSTLWGGSYIDQRQLYARKLESALNRGLGPARIEVLNIGVNGWGPFHEHAYLKAFGNFAADLAIVTGPLGDIYRSLHTLSATPYMSISGPPSSALEEVLFHFSWRYRTWRIGAEPPTNEIRAQGIAEYVELAKGLQASGSEVLFEALPSAGAGFMADVPKLEQSDATDLGHSLGKVGVPLGFPAGLFKGRGELAQLYHDGIHLEVLGHEVYAQYLEQRLKSISLKLQSFLRSVPTKTEGRL